MEHYDQRDSRNLTASPVVQEIAGNTYMGKRYDSVDDASVFFARELDVVKSKAYDKQYPELSALQYMPITSEVDAGAETATWYGYEVTGLADIINNYAEDLPRADVKGEPTTVHIKSVGDSYGYNAQEMRASVMTGKSLDARKATAARRAHDMKINQIAFIGSDKDKMVGLFSEEAGIPEYALSEVEVDGETYTEFKYKTADQILADLNGMQMYVDQLTNSIERPDTLALPSYIYMDLATRRIPDTQITILKFLQDNSPYIKNWESWNELGENAALFNTSGKNVAFLYTKSAEKFSLELPMPFTQYPVQVRNLESVIPCESRCAGLMIYYPLSMLLAFGL
ncbi:MAG: DUF2184 domain-containing protein [Clostridiales bacterium]|nr:DUF2184 domain-containing protein [Clostridiales bacterium]